MARRMLWLIILAAALGLGVAGCSKNEEKPADETVDDEHKGARDEGPRFGLKWGYFDQHPARTAVEHCHLLDDVELNLLRYLVDEAPVDADDAAPIFGDKIDKDADEFEQKRQRDAVAAKVAAKVAELSLKPLCVRHKIGIGEYDFNRQGFSLSDDVLPIVFDDLSQSSEHNISRLEIRTSTRRPDGYRFPGLLGLGHLPNYLHLPESRAESVLKQLPKIEKTGDESNSKDDGLNKLERIGAVLGRMEPEAIEAMLFAEKHIPEGTEEMPIGKAFEKLRAEMSTVGTGRKADAIIVFRPLVFQKMSESIEGVRLQFSLTSGVATQFVVATPDGEVFAVAPDLKKEELGRRGQRQEIDRDAQGALLEQVCGEKARVKVKTRVQNGELVDIYSSVCRSCPPGASDRWGGASLEDVTFGSFTHPGAVEALVRTAGCEPMVNGGGGMTLVEQRADGQWKRIHYTPGAFDQPEIVADPSGRDLIISKFEQVGGGAASGSVSFGVAGSKGVQETVLFPIADNRHACTKDYLVIEPAEMRREDLDNDGVLDLIFAVNFHQGTREGNQCDFGENDGIGDGETLELSYLIRDAKLVLSEDSKPVHARLNRAFEGETP